MIEIELPYPPSTNDLWQPVIRRVNGKATATLVLSAKAKRYKVDCGWFAKKAGVRKPLAGLVQIEARLYPVRPEDWRERQRKYGDAWDVDVRCIDADNGVKVAIDGLKQIAFGDDRYVWRYTIERMEPDERGARLVLVITPYARPTPQGDMFGRAELDEGVLCVSTAG